MEEKGTRIYENKLQYCSTIYGAIYIIMYVGQLEGTYVRYIFNAMIHIMAILLRKNIRNVTGVYPVVNRIN